MSLRLVPARLRGARGDDGLTLPELLISSLFLVVILLIVGGMFLGTWRSGATVQGLTESSQQAQVVASSIDDAARNAAGTPRVALVPGGQVLGLTTAEVAANGTTSWVCEAWLFDAADPGSVYWSQAPAVSLGLDLTLDVDGLLAARDWLELASGVGAADGATLPFSSSADSVSYAFHLRGSGERDVLVENTVHLRPHATGSTVPVCLT